MDGNAWHPRDRIEHDVLELVPWHDIQIARGVARCPNPTVVLGRPVFLASEHEELLLLARGEADLADAARADDFLRPVHGSKTHLGHAVVEHLHEGRIRVAVRAEGQFAAPVLFDLGACPAVELQQLGVGDGVTAALLAPVEKALVRVIALEAGDAHVHQPFRSFQVKTAVFRVRVVGAEGWLVAFPIGPDGFAVTVTQSEGGIGQCHAQAALELPALGPDALDEGFVLDVRPDSARDVEVTPGGEHLLRCKAFLIEPEQPHADIAELRHLRREPRGLRDLAERGVRGHA